VLHLLGATIAQRVAAPNVTDPRSSLQEQLAGKGRVVTFDYDRAGPDHAVLYTATAIVDEKVVGTGTGASKKSAAIEAARIALRGRE
jgi:ribonuclease-3